MTYAGLTTADKGALLDAKARGAEWIAREGNEEGDLFAYPDRPSKSFNPNFWKAHGIWMSIENDLLEFISFSDTEPVNIDLALAQIEEMETAQTPTLPPLTWNERINQMTVDEKAEYFIENDFCIVMLLPEHGCFEFNSCKECLTSYFNSPYKEGETDEG